jgi:hypothetical protein
MPGAWQGTDLKRDRAQYVPESGLALTFAQVKAI